MRRPARLAGTLSFKHGMASLVEPRVFGHVWGGLFGRWASRLSGPERAFGAGIRIGIMACLGCSSDWWPRGWGNINCPGLRRYTPKDIPESVGPARQTPTSQASPARYGTTDMGSTTSVISISAISRASFGCNTECRVACESVPSLAASDVSQSHLPSRTPR